jgi:hypothetical protein
MMLELGDYLIFLGLGQKKNANIFCGIVMCNKLQKVGD